MSKCIDCRNYDDCDEGWRFSGDANFELDCFKTKQETLFDRITASPEVLAEKLVYCSISGWTSALINFHTFHHEEALAATVAKLKEE